MASRRARFFFFGLLAATHSLILSPRPLATPRFREPRSRILSRAGVASGGAGSLEDAMVAFLQELPPVRLEKPRTGKNKRTKPPQPLTRATATATLAALSSSRGVAGNQAALRQHLHDCAAAGYFDLTVAGFVGPHRAEARNLRSAEATLARASEIAKTKSSSAPPAGKAGTVVGGTDAAGSAATAAAAVAAAESEARADAELTLLAAACAFATGDAVLGRKVLRVAAVPAGDVATSALVESLAKGSQAYGGGSAFQLALRLRSDAAASSPSLSARGSGSSSQKGNSGNSKSASEEGLSANALGEMFRALRHSGPLIARPPAWSTATGERGAQASAEGSDWISESDGADSSSTSSGGTSSSSSSSSSSEGSRVLDLELCGAGSGVLCSGSEAELGDPRERLALALDLLEDMRTQGLRPHPEAGSAVAMSAFRAAVEEGWGTFAATDDDDDDDVDDIQNGNRQKQTKQPQKQGKGKTGGASSSSSSKGEAYVNRRGSTGGPSTSLRGPLAGAPGGSGSSTGQGGGSSNSAVPSARHPARAAFRSVARTLGDAGLGWGYGALHATLEGAVALSDFATTRDVLQEFQLASLGPKVTTFHAILRPLADSGDGAAALAVLGHICGEAQALAVAAVQAEEFKAKQRADEIAATAVSTLTDSANSSETKSSSTCDDGSAKAQVDNDENDDEDKNSDSMSSGLLLGGQGGQAYQPGNGWWVSVAPRPLSPYALAKQQQEEQQQKQMGQQQTLRQGQQLSQLRFPGGARAAAAAQAADEAAEVAARQAFQAALEAATALGVDCKTWVAPTDPLSIALTTEALLGRSETRPLAEALMRAVLPEAWSEDVQNANDQSSKDGRRTDSDTSTNKASKARLRSPVLWTAALRVQILLGNGDGSGTTTSTTSVGRNEIVSTLQRASTVLDRLTGTAVGEGTSFSVNGASSSGGASVSASSGARVSHSSPLLVLLEALAARHGTEGRRAGIALLLATIPPHLRLPQQQQNELMDSGRRRADEEEAAAVAACVSAGHFTCAGRAAWHRLAVLCAEAGDAASAVALVSALNNVRNLAARAEVNPLSAAAAANIAGEESIAVSPSSRAVDSSAAAFILSELLDRECLSACVVACAANGQIDAALDMVDNLDERGWRPTEAAYVALMRAFGRKLDLPAALGVWSELTATSSGANGNGDGKSKSSSSAALRVRPSRRAYQAAVDASVTHPSGLRHACSILAKMVTDGYSLSAVHHDTLILGFGQARNLEAALAVFQDQTYKRSAVAAAASDTAAAAVAKSTSSSSGASTGKAPGKEEAGKEGRNSGKGKNAQLPTGANTVKVEVSEDVLAALLEAARRNGDADSLDEAVRLLQIYGVEPPAALVRYLAPAQYGNGGPRSALYDRIYGRDGSQAAEAASVAVANLLTARNLARVASNGGQSVIDNAYRDATGASSFGRGDYGDSQKDEGGDGSYADYQRRPQRSGERLSGDDANAGGFASANAAATAAAEAKARADTTPGRMWTFDGRAATMKLQAVAAQAPPLRLTRGLPLEAIAGATAMKASKRSSSGSGGSGNGGGSTRASSVRPLQPMAESAKAGGKGKSNGVGGSGGSGNKGSPSSVNKVQGAARPRAPKKMGPSSDADRKPGGVPSRNKNRR